MLNEVHPFLYRRGAFNPNGLIELANQQVRFSYDDHSRFFYKNLHQVNRRARKSGKRVILRAHSHTDYFVPGSIPRLTSFFPRQWPQIAVVRNPVDNWLSASSRGFFKGEFEEYFSRWQSYIEDVKRFPLFDLEDIISNPESAVVSMMRELKVPERSTPRDPEKLPRLSGDNRNPSMLGPHEFKEGLMKKRELARKDLEIFSQVEKAAPKVNVFLEMVGLDRFRIANDSWWNLSQ